MDWVQVTVALGGRPPAPAEDALNALGAVAIELADGADQPILEPAPGETPLWSRIHLRALLPGDVNPDQIRLVLAAALPELSQTQVEFKRVAERDWVAAFKNDLAPCRFGDNLWICPTQSPPPKQGTVVRLDPGLAFGTGRHATTALCLEWLAALSPGSHLLDYGCGSGILAVAGACLGHAAITAVDNDPQALLATEDNAAANGMGERIATCAPEALSAAFRADTVVANILSNTLIQLAPTLLDHCAPGARIALSGILDNQSARVREAYAARVEFTDDRRRDGWVLLSGSLRG